MFAKLTKALVAALVLAGVSTALVANASARPTGGSWHHRQTGYQQERSNPTNTNGF